MRLSPLQKAEILAKLKDKVNANQLAKEYGVAKSTISLLKKRNYDEMMHSSRRNEIFNRTSGVSRSDERSNWTSAAFNEDEVDNDDEGIVKMRAKRKILTSYLVNCVAYAKACAFQFIR